MKAPEQTALGSELDKTKTITCAQLADALERAHKLLSGKEHQQIARHIERIRKQGRSADRLSALR